VPGHGVTGAWRTLPIRVPPCPGEALDSWLEALAARLRCPLGDLAPAVGLDSLRAEDPGHRGRKAPDWTIALRDSEARSIAIACELNIEDVHAMTLRHYHDRAVIVRADTRQVNRHRLWGRATGSRYCPSCLAESGGRWRLSWRLGWSFACTLHRALLADACWRCGRHQRLHVMPAGTIPDPGKCASPGGGSGRLTPRCGADLTSTPVLLLPDGHPVLDAQQLILRSVRQGTADFGIYTRAPVSRFLADIRAVASLLLTLPGHHELAQHMPADIAVPFARARALSHSRSAPSASRARPGLDAPGRAEITAVVTTIAARALAQDGIDQAAAALSWVFTLRPRTRAAAPIRGQLAGSELIPRLQRAAISRPAANATRTRRSAASRARNIPALLWPAWTVALAPPQRHYRQTFQQLAHSLSVLLALTGSASSTAAAGRQLGACYPPDRIALLLHQLRCHPRWASAEAEITSLAGYLDANGSPIDYKRRRSLDYRGLLPEQEWQRLSRKASQFPGRNRRHPAVRRWLFERISGLPAEKAPRAFALTEPQQRREVSAFPADLTPDLLRQLDAHAREFLAGHEVLGEPVTWSPPAELMTGNDLPGVDLSQCHAGTVHHLLRDEHLSLRHIAGKLGTSIDAVRCTLTEQPAPLTPSQQRADGRLTWTLSQQVSATELKRLHHDEHHSTTALARKFNVPVTVINDLLRTHAIPRRARPRRTPDIDPAWLSRGYLTDRRPLPDLAREIGVSTSHLNRQAKSLGIPLRPKGGASHSPARLIGPREIQTAQDMLASGHYTVRDVAGALGFTPRTIYRHITKEYRSTAPKRSQALPGHPGDTSHWPPDREGHGIAQPHDHE
jgi:AraC-like DNA-binding protein